MLILDALDGVTKGSPAKRRQRHDWVRADVRCLMCGRLLGRLLGTARTAGNGKRPTGHPVAFIAYRPHHPDARVIPFSTTMRFRCGVCGGAGSLDDVEVFSTYDEALTDDTDDDDDAPPVPKRGRPPVALPRQAATGVDAALKQV